MAKGELSNYEQFLLLAQSFQRSSNADTSESIYLWKRVNFMFSGYLLTDAMVEYHIDKRESNDTWGLAAIALLSAGGIRASTEIGL